MFRELTERSLFCFSYLKDQIGVLTKLRQRQGGIRNPPLTPRISCYKGNADLAMPMPVIRGLFQMSGVI